MLAQTAGDTPFRPASTLEETRRQHLAIPAPSEEIWWAATGRDMAWNNKNLHQIVPTVNVYRDGPVRPLAARYSCPSG